ncbi:MAG: hypothetical protein GY778_16825 [bacterium]|nr:hypothetical protein [bacterium]
MIVGASGVLPAFVMRCDKAALNFQKGLTQGLGFEASELIADRAIEDRDAQNESDDD